MTCLSASPSNRRGFCLRICPILSNFAIIIFSIASMNFLHYLYVKADNCRTQLSGWPRLAISWPLWLTFIFLFPLKIVGSLWWVAYGVAYITIYLLVLAIYPPKLVRKNYGKWKKKYNDTSSLWFYLYLLLLPFISLMIIAYIRAY